MSSNVRPADGNKHSHSHSSCHTARVRRFIVPALLVLLTTFTFLVFELVDFGSNAGVGIAGGLLPRAVDGGTGTSNGTPFVKNKCQYSKS